MTRVNILTSGFTSSNGCAFLFPLLVHRRALQDAGITLALHDNDADHARLADCDVLIVDNKVYGPRWITENDAIVETFARLSAVAPKLFYFDITDSSGWDHARVLPYVTGYFKNQLLRDRSLYLRPLHGYRLYTDHYHQNDGVTDADQAASEPVGDAGLLAKLHVGWNSGLADYSLLGPLRMALYRRMPLGPLLRFPQQFTAAGTDRGKDVSCRIGTGYPRATVAHQRQRMRAALGDRIDTEKLSRRAYLHELAESKIVVSPFGLGEITLRDFEIFLAGAATLKPDMSHMETWPDLFRGDETILAHQWDLSDLDATIDSALAEPARRVEIAARAQSEYRRHLIGPEAARLFVERVQAILKVGAEPSSRAAE